jgi:hypothetical protein
MRRNLRLAVALTVAIVFVTGCPGSTANSNLFKTVGVTIKTVDLGMTVWGQYVRDGHATAEQEGKVKLGYEDYQTALRTAQTGLHVSDNSATPEMLRKAAADLMAIIQQFTGQKIAAVILVGGVA